MYDKTPGQIVGYHRSMLADRVRTSRYRQAVAETVNPGDVVLDLGCGTGILSFFACRAGAARVYAVEMGPVVEIARSVCRDSGLEDRVVFLNELSTRVQLPERVDVIVTETIGNFGLDEGILGSLIDARRRFLKQGGRIVPQVLELSVAPVELPGFYEGIELWTDDLYGLDYSSARAQAANNIGWVELSPDSLLSDPATLKRFDLAEVDKTDFQGEASFVARRPGVLHGIGGWFAATLKQGVYLSTKPPLEAPSWRHGFFPVERPVQLEEGDQVRIAIRSGANGGLWRWRVECFRPDPAAIAAHQIAAFDHATLFGQLLSPANLRKRGISHVPHLTEKALADLYILQSMDGSGTVADIANRARDAFPLIFVDAAMALERVRELAGKYSQ